MTDRMVEILYFISSGLLAPTLIVLLIFMVSTLVMLGGLAREAIDRRRIARKWHHFVSYLHTGTASVNDFYELRLTGYPARFQSRIAALRDNSLAVKKCLEDLEMDIARRLSWLAFATRVGPILGLVGTLVPLGPALTGLAAGDIQALSGNLVIAFTTTVFGILVGGFAYAASLVRRAWYEQDLSDLEFIASLLNPQPEPCRA
ncbi:MAG: MotA/TolQ/ExbB proton channel family protein [Planctomycetia bacterium]|nr:MotA/TolQ/ExbB proton channel family protein [Planctomycetia bacterium]